jgi:ComF family protein
MKEKLAAAPLPGPEKPALSPEPDRAQAKGALRPLLDLLLPPRCLSCRQPVSEDRALCGSCWADMRFIAEPFCQVCAYPFPFDAGSEILCGSCSQALPLFRRARAVLRYDGASRAMLLAFKHADRTAAAPSFAAWMARAGITLLRETDLMVPVPLHRRRLFLRRYNQAALLAAALGRLKGTPVVVPDLLERTKATASQGHLSPAERARNVSAAFRLRPGAESLVEGKAILLVDDVLTTGATVSACTRVLLRAGAASVDVMVLARVLPEGGGGSPWPFTAAAV